MEKRGPVEDIRDHGAFDLCTLSSTCRFFRIAFTVPLLRRIRDTLIRRLSDILQNNNNVRLLNYLLDDGLPVGQLKELRNCEQ